VVLITSAHDGLAPTADALPGISATLSKPIHLHKLHASLEQALRLHADVVDTPPSPPPTPSPAPPTRLLLAEDNPTNRKVALAMLSGAGYDVDTVPDGAAAVAALTARNYDAILMDCQMPELDGYEATAAIRAQEGKLRHTPIIAMTAGARREDKERCLAAGMDAYLAKPVSRPNLLAVVAQSLKPKPTAPLPF